MLPVSLGGRRGGAPGSTLNTSIGFPAFLASRDRPCPGPGSDPPEVGVCSNRTAYRTGSSFRTQPSLLVSR